jgi:fructosamine-3-kinase
MGPWRDIERSIGAASGTPFAVASRTAIGGGCINECYLLRGAGRAYFAKVNAPSRADMFAAEAAGLAEIARSRTVRVPRPLCHGWCSSISSCHRETTGAWASWGATSRACTT